MEILLVLQIILSFFSSWTGLRPTKTLYYSNIKGLV